MKRNWQGIKASRPVYPMAVLLGECVYPPLEGIMDALRLCGRRLWSINATEIALELGNSILANIVILATAVASPVLDIQEGLFQKVLKESSPEKVIQAFHKGRESLQSN